MKKIYFLALSIVFALPLVCNAQVEVEIIDGINNQILKNKIENNTSRFLSEIYDAFNQNRALNLTDIVTSDGELSIEMLWENVHFRPEDQYIGEILLNTNEGYQIRNIPLILRPQESNPTDEYKEAVVNFDRNGNVSGLYFSIDNNTYSNIMEKGLQLNDIARRLEILDYVERFRTSYNQKDIKFLNQVFSDDALIVTGKVIKAVPTKMKLRDDNSFNIEHIEYSKQSKKEYLNKLSHIFKANRWINVNFSEVSIAAHPTKGNWYGVTLKQNWSASNGYNDTGWIFMLWDFSDPNTPVIHVRTWQPDKFNGREITENEAFSFDDLNIFD